jgi:hypothetical protein
MIAYAILLPWWAVLAAVGGLVVLIAGFFCLVIMLFKQGRDNSEE